MTINFDSLPLPKPNNSDYYQEMPELLNWTCKIMYTKTSQVRLTLVHMYICQNDTICFYPEFNSSGQIRRVCEVFPETIIPSTKLNPRKVHPQSRSQNFYCLLPLKQLHVPRHAYSYVQFNRDTQTANKYYLRFLTAPIPPTAPDTNLSSHPSAIDAYFFTDPDILY